MMQEKEYIKDTDGRYFSGQGDVSLEKDGKIYYLGNCPRLDLYLNGNFILEWESFGQNTLELILGDYAGEETVDFQGIQKDLKLRKYVIKKDSKRDYILHFSGMNTADSNRVTYARVEVSIENTETLPLINDELVKMVSYGKWNGDIELYCQKPDHNVPAPITMYKKAGLFKVTPSVEFQEKGFKEFYFNADKMISIENAPDYQEGVPNSSFIVFDHQTYVVPVTPDEFVSRMHGAWEYDAIYSTKTYYREVEHREASTGNRLTDFKLTTRP